jgi:ribokinase
MALDTFLTSACDILSTSSCGGGQAANFAIAAAECGVNTSLFSAVGRDSASVIALAELRSVDLSYVHRSNRTTEALIFIEPSGERDILISPSDQQMPANAKAISGVDWDHIHFTSLPLVKHIDLQKSIADLAPAATRSLDIGALYAQIGRHQLAKLLKGLHFLFATELELETFTGISLPRATKVLFEDGVHAVCCKRGAEGASLYVNDGTVIDSVAPIVRSVDSTGAGDVFAAVFVSARLWGVPNVSALQIATNLASNSVTARGRQAYPTSEDFFIQLKSSGVPFDKPDHAKGPSS